MRFIGSVVRKGEHKHIRFFPKLIQYIRIASHILELHPREILHEHGGLIGPYSAVVAEQHDADVIGFMLSALER